MKYFIYTIITLVAVAIIAGFFVAGSPTRQRLIRFDSQRINDLQYIQSEIINYWQSKSKLPARLTDLNDSLRGVNVPKDPEIGGEYEYSIKAPLSFSLCANFNYSLSGNSSPGVMKPVPVGSYGTGIADNWEHSAGRVCFDRTIDKDFYKPYPPAKQ